jgi:hypothetical protein
MKQLGSHWADFHEIFIFGYFSKTCRENSFHLNGTNTRGTLYVGQYTFSITCRSILLRMRTVSGRAVERIKIHIFIFYNFFSQKSLRFLDNVEKYCRARQATHDDMTHALCMLDN